MTDLNILLLGVVVSFVAAAGAYVSIRAQFGYRDGHELEPQGTDPYAVPGTSPATAHEPRPAVDG